MTGQFVCAAHGTRPPTAPGSLSTCYREFRRNEQIWEREPTLRVAPSSGATIGSRNTSSGEARAWLPPSAVAGLTACTPGETLRGRAVFALFFFAEDWVVSVSCVVDGDPTSFPPEPEVLLRTLARSRERHNSHAFHGLSGDKRF